MQRENLELGSLKFVWMLLFFFWFGGATWPVLCARGSVFTLCFWGGGRPPNLIYASTLPRQEHPIIFWVGGRYIFRRELLISPLDELENSTGLGGGDY